MNTEIKNEITPEQVGGNIFGRQNLVTAKTRREIAEAANATRAFADTGKNPVAVGNFTWARFAGIGRPARTAMAREALRLAGVDGKLPVRWE